MNLIFKALRLCNYQSFAGDHFIDFTAKPGLCYVTGINNKEIDLTSNGAGKSTLFNGLVWTLTGRTLRSVRPGATVETWSSSDTTIGETVIIKDDKEFKIHRSRKPNTLTLNGEIVEQAAIDKTIGLSYEVLTHAIIIGQFNDMFLDLRAEAQSALFTELLDLDIWLTAADKASKLARDYNAQLNDLSLKIANLNGQEHELNQQIETLEQREREHEEKQAAERSRLEAELAEAERNLKAVTDALGDAPSSATLLEAIGVAETAIARLRASKSATEQAAIPVERKAASVEQMINSLKASLNAYTISENDPVCPECGQTVSQQHIKDKITSLKKQMESSLKEHNELIDKLETFDEQCKVFDQVLAHQDELRRGLHSSLKEVQEEIAQYQLKTSRAENGVAVAKRALLQDVINPFIELAQSAKDKLTALKCELEQTLLKHADVSALTGTYKLWSDGFKQIRLNLIDETLEELELAVNRHADRLGLHDWFIKFATERETLRGDVRPRFTVLLFPPGSDKPISWESFSGGESQRWQLATIFGLSEVLLTRAGLSTNLLILDEPTHHLSERGVEFLLEYLKERTEDLQTTVFFIDHKSLDSGYFDNILRVEKDERGSSLKWM